MQRQQGHDEDKGDWYEVVALPEQSLTEAKAAKLAEINGICDSILKEAVKTYPDTEVMTFDQQVKEAEAYCGPVPYFVSFSTRQPETGFINRITRGKRGKNETGLLPTPYSKTSKS